MNLILYLDRVNIVKSFVSTYISKILFLDKKL